MPRERRPPSNWSFYAPLRKPPVAVTGYCAFVLLCFVAEFSGAAQDQVASEGLSHDFGLGDGARLIGVAGTFGMPEAGDQLMHPMLRDLSAACWPIPLCGAAEAGAV